MPKNFPSSMIGLCACGIEPKMTPFHHFWSRFSAQMFLSTNQFVDVIVCVTGLHACVRACADCVHVRSSVLPHFLHTNSRGLPSVAALLYLVLRRFSPRESSSRLSTSPFSRTAPDAAHLGGGVTTIAPVILTRRLGATRKRLRATFL